MLKNYIKIALAVLKRRKFFTFISLFGISFTLTIIMVVTAFLDHLFSPSYPDINRDRELYITEIRMSSKKGNGYDGEMSAYYVNQYISRLKGNLKLAMYTEPKPTYTYVNNKKMIINVKYTNDQFWEVFQYEFLEGKPFGKQQLVNAEKVIVISEDTRKNYFGDDQAVVGKYLETDNTQYRVMGVVKNIPASLRYHYGDAFLPYTESKEDLTARINDGPFLATILVDDKKNLADVQEAYQQIVAKIPMDGKVYDKIQSYADSYLTIFTKKAVPDNDGSETGTTRFFTIGGLIFFLFLLLPTLNLVSLNITRISERSSEIGVRKAFGASSKILVIQFMVENIILTLIGGLIGVVLSFVIIQLINNSHFVENLHLSINFTVLSYSLLACLLFGLISGVYPAWRMSKLHVVTALKA